jgi:hypothetical protein
MALREVSPLTTKQYRFVVKKLKKEEKKAGPKRLTRIKEATKNASKMKMVYH